MFENVKTPAEVSASTRAAVGTEQTGTSNSYCHFSTPSPKKQDRIADHLLRGEANAIPRAQLAEQLGFSSVRALQAAIADEVHETGALILASPRGGYFLAETRDELLKYKQSLRSRAKNTFRRLHAVNIALLDCPDQISMEVKPNEE